MEETFINVPNSTDTEAAQIATITLPGETAQIQEISTVHGFVGGDTIDTITSISLSGTFDVATDIAYNEATPWTKDTFGVFSIPAKAKSILLAPTAYTFEVLTTMDTSDFAAVFVLVLMHEIDAKLWPFAYFSSPEERFRLNVPNFQNVSPTDEKYVLFCTQLSRSYSTPLVIPTLGCTHARLFLQKIDPAELAAPLTDSLIVNLLFLDHFVGGAPRGGMLRGAEDIFFPSDMAGDQ